MKPFLKWPGNKQKIARTIHHHIIDAGGPNSQDVIFEPFAGSSAFSLRVYGINLHSKHRHYFLNDINSDLISAYRRINTASDKTINDIIHELKTKYFTPENNTKEKYLELRDKFNNKAQIKSDIEEFCLFVYLNRHCFNGLIRYNKSGKFNVPFGKFNKVSVPEEQIRNFHGFCRRAGNENCLNVDFLNLGFEQCFDLIKRYNNTIVYCDPPYFPLSKTSSFVDYSPNNEDDWVSPAGSQKKLVELAEEITSNKKNKNIVAISNHDVPEFRELTKNAKQYHLIDAKRNIAANKEDRKTIKEALAIFY